MSAAFEQVKGFFAAGKRGPKPAGGEGTDEQFGPAGSVEGMHVDARPTRPAVPPDAPHRTGGDTAEVAVDDLPAELGSRVMAATAHASHRSIRREDDRFCVWALCGDRIVSLALAFRDDGSVAEDSQTFLAGAVTGVGLDGDDLALDVLAPSGSRRVRVPAAFARALRGRTADHP